MGRAAGAHLTPGNLYVEPMMKLSHRWKPRDRAGRLPPLAKEGPILRNRPSCLGWGLCRLRGERRWWDGITDEWWASGEV